MALPSSSPFVFAAASLCLLLALIFVLWTLLWKFVLEPNPLIRDFFDLDKKDNKAGVNKRTNKGQDRKIS